MLNYLLAPLQTRVFTDQSDYGTISELYAYATFLNVLFMFGLETSFFRYATKTNDPQKVFGTGQISLLCSTFLFSLGLLIASGPLSRMLGYPGHADYIVFFALIIGFDTLVNIPFARLRLQGKPFRYASLKLLNVCINISLNFFFLLPGLLGKPGLFRFTGYIYHPEMGVSYVFIANLSASAITFLIFLPSMLNLHFDRKIWMKLMGYGLPLIIIGFAGMINETLDRVLLKYFLPYGMEENLRQVGIYSAVYKLSIFMTLAVQGFRMGAEPFFFSHSVEKNAQKLYADVMKYFVIVCCIIFLAVGMFLDAFKIIIGVNYWSGLPIVPILLMANLCLGMYYNQSVWYKLTDKTAFAMIVPVSGAIITLFMNWILIPRIGYVGSAVATFGCYFSMVVMSWVIGQRYYHVPYNMRKILMYLFSAVILCGVGNLIMYYLPVSVLVSVILRLFLFGIFLLLAWWLDAGDMLARMRRKAQ